MGMAIKLPIGIENFQKIRTEGFYYVDKTGLIMELLNNWGEVNLFTRPRRFGKSLNMSMLRYFFEYECDTTLFDGLAIAGERELCRQYMGRFPVVSITLKGISSLTFEGARAMLCSTIGREALRFSFLSESDRLSPKEKGQYDLLTCVGGRGGPEFVMGDQVLESSLQVLTHLLHRHYGQKVILLIDEYDVPLDKAQQFGYYDEMVSLVRNLFGQALKTNDSLYFAVLTGCLRISKESIFTGLNNFKIFSITNARCDEYFGFSDREVLDMLRFYGLEQKYKLIKEWYDGYRFGGADVYCPWDVINYVDLLNGQPDADPQAFWLNSSGNEIIRRFLAQARQSTRREIERLIEGQIVEKRINQELTYRELYDSMDNLWSVLFTTGYLTVRGKADGDVLPLVIPNLEIRKIFIDQVMAWFRHEAGKDTGKLDALCDAFAGGDQEAVESRFSAYLKKTISIRDTGVRKGKKENFYHGILLGLLSHREEWDISSNAESGEGFSDILVEIEEEGVGLVIEMKYPDGGSLDHGCREALEQIEAKGYEQRLLEDGMGTIFKFGIACRRKECRVMMARGVSDAVR